MSEKIDVIVVGGGVAGLCAAAAAARDGLQVGLFESGPALGGSILLSAGSLWTFPTTEEYLAHCPGADPALARLVVDAQGDSAAWLESVGVEVLDRGPSLYGPSSSRGVAPRQLVDALTAFVAERVDVRCGTTVTGLEPVEDGYRIVAGDVAHSASAVVVATGGVHADPGILHDAGLDHYVGLVTRNRHEGGDGVRLARAAGASLTGTPDGIYGHLVPEGIAEGLATAADAAQYQSRAGILLGLDGAVLAEPGTADHDLNRLVARVPGRRAVLLFDSTATPYPGGIDGIGTSWASGRAAFAERHGDRAASVGSLDELRGALSGWGVPFSAEARALAERHLRNAPFTAVVVQPSLTHAGAGIAVDASLRAVGTERLWVAGADVGRGFGDGYGGGISFAVTTGLAAGRRLASFLAA